MLTADQKVELAARNQVLAHRFGRAAAPANPWRRGTRSHVIWDMARRKTENALATADAALADLARIGRAPLETPLAITPAAYGSQRPGA